MWSGPLGVLVLVIVLVGVAGLAYLVMRISGAMPLPRRTSDRPAQRCNAGGLADRQACVRPHRVGVWGGTSGTTSPTSGSPRQCSRLLRCGQSTFPSAVPLATASNASYT